MDILPVVFPLIHPYQAEGGSRIGRGTRIAVMVLLGLAGLLSLACLAILAWAFLSLGLA